MNEKKGAREMFITRALEKILSDKEIKKSYHAQLRKTCQVALEEIKKDTNFPQDGADSGTLPIPQSDAVMYADKYFLPFELACQSKCARIVEISLDCLQKLIANRYLSGNAPDSTQTGKRLIDRIVKTICNCFVGENTNVGTQLQIIKALLTVITSEHVEIHEGTVLMAVRTCFNIHLASKDLINQRAAQATLSQMLNTIFARMEQQAACAAAATPLPLEEEGRTAPNDAEDKTEEAEAVDCNGSGSVAEKDSQSEETLNEGGGTGNQSETLTEGGGKEEEGTTKKRSSPSVSPRRSESDAVADNAVAGTDQPLTRSDKESVSSQEADDGDGQLANSGHEEIATAIVGDLLNQVSTELRHQQLQELKDDGGSPLTTPPSSPQSNEKDPSSPPSIQSTSLSPRANQGSPSVSAPLTEPPAIQLEAPTDDAVGSVSITADNLDLPDPTEEYPSGRLAPAEDAMSTQSAEGMIADTSAFTHVLQIDAFLVFRSLCKLSMKPLNDNPDPRSHAMRSKVLSLELLLSILQKAGPVFKTHEKFTSALKQYLCVALSKNGASTVPEVFFLSLCIFVELLFHFKQHLKMQIEVFFREIFLPILKIQLSSSLDQKLMVVQALSTICGSAQCVVDLYVNYDCDLNLANIFQTLVNDLARLAGGRQSMELGAHSSQERSMNIRVKGLDCVVSVLKCMVEWSQDLYVNPHDLSNLGREGQPIPRERDTDSGTGTLANSHSQSSSSLNSSAADSTGAVLGADDPGQYEVLKQQKGLLETGIEKFNRKPQKGLEYLQEQGLVGELAESVAEFFLKEDRLDKTGLGDYLGENKDFNKEVMYSYVDQLDFNRTAFVPALRIFLGGFRLPGEAQKIDRLVEKFASRYLDCNKGGVFASADAAYVLAYSVVMLTTDLHNPQVKKKMTKEEYIKLNAGINDTANLPQEYLSDIYDEIAANKIEMKPSQKPGSKVIAPSTVAANPRLRRTQYLEEMDHMTRTAKGLMESISHVKVNFVNAAHHEHVRPMFRVCWTPFLAVFSMGLQDCDDPRISDLCLEGIRCAIRIACIFHMEVERNAYVQALARFTLLTANTPLTEMKAKNIDTMKTLIAIAHTDGNYLGTSWLEILQCISRLELAQFVGTGVKRPHHPSRKMSGKNSSKSAHPIDAFDPEVIARGDTKRMASLQELMGETSSQSVTVAVDRVFAGSVRLNGDAIVEFVVALCEVSQGELSTLPAHPRMFSLQKIVEICFFNMGRIRLQWSRIWAVLGKYFNEVGCNANEDVAFFAVDSLRQLSMKFLEKGEFSNFRFQKDFLRPFEHISTKIRSLTIREMVVECVAQMVNAQAANIKSGWKNIFSVFHVAASDTNEAIVTLAFQTTGKVITSIFPKYFPAIIDSFQEAVKTLSEFACNVAFPDTSMEAIRLIRACARYVAEKPRMFIDHASELDPSQSPRSSSEEDRVWVKGWFPILFELSCIINRCKLDVRTRGLTVMFEIMKTYGESFQLHWWRDLFRIIFRIFDNLKLPEQQSEASQSHHHGFQPHADDFTSSQPSHHSLLSHPIAMAAASSSSAAPSAHKTEWMATTCNHALYAVVDVFTQYYDRLQEVLLPDLYSQLFWCVQQDNEQLARSGTNCLENLVISNGARFSEQVWDRTCACMLDIFRTTTPHSLLLWKPEVVDGIEEGITSTISETGSVPPSPATVAQRAGGGSGQVATPGGGPRLSQRSESMASVQSFTSVTSVDSTKDHKIPKSKTKGGSSGGGAFSSLLIQCVVQLELIQAIDNIVFYPAKSKRADEEYLAAAKSVELKSEEVEEEEDLGMYQYLTVDQLLQLVDCLIESHTFAKRFNSDHEQRNALWKAGFRGKAKPNLLKQETQSLACALRILFRMAQDSQLQADWDGIHSKLIQLQREGLDHFLSLTSDGHRDAWKDLIMLGLTRFSRLPHSQFEAHSKAYYQQLCDLLLVDLRPEIKWTLRKCFVRIGSSFGITP